MHHVERTNNGAAGLEHDHEGESTLPTWTRIKESREGAMRNTHRVW